MIDQSRRICEAARNPIKLSFSNLDYEVQTLDTGKDGKSNGTTQKRIIKDVSGYAMPGQTLFIMGASGAGKTTLLNILSGRISDKDGNKLSGSITVNDTMKCDDENFGLISGYVMQDDILFQHFTPREALHFAANMKLG